MNKPLSSVKTAISAIAACAFFHFAAHADNLILNGSFEEPPLAAGTAWQVAPTSWVRSGSLAYIIHGDYSTLYPLAQEGDQYAGLGNSSSLSQTFEVGTAGTYMLTWFDSSEYNGPNNSSPYSVAVIDSAGAAVSSANFDANAGSLRAWVKRSIPLTLTSGKYTLRFEGHVAVSGEGSLIDNVSIPGTKTDITMLDATTTDFVHINVKYSVAGSQAPAFIIRAYISSDETFDQSDLPLQPHLGIPDEENRQPNPDGSAKEHSTTLTLGSLAPVRDDHRFVIVVADPDSAIEETNENNNATFVIPVFNSGDQMNRAGQIQNRGLSETSDFASGPFTGAILPGTADWARLLRLDSYPSNPPEPWGAPPFVFEDYNYNDPAEPLSYQKLEDRLVQPSLIPPTRSLVKLINLDLSRRPDLWKDSLFRINEAYDSVGEHDSLTSLHYEGRALDFSGATLGGSPARLGRLAGLAWLSGFDFVYFESDHIHVSEHASFATTIDQNSLQESLTSARSLRLIDNDGILTALDATLNGVEEALLTGNEVAALGKLGAFNQFIAKQSGKHINKAFASLLLLNSLILQDRIQLLGP